MLKRAARVDGPSFSIAIGPDPRKGGKWAFCPLELRLSSKGNPHDQAQPSEPDSLNGHTYQARILSPDNFWRFNDALIQSCLWRAALYSELDYRGSSLTSRIFSDLVLKYIDESKNKKSDIVCDYLIALTIGKIKICKECIERIVTHGKSELDNDNPALEVIASIEEKFLPQEKSRVEAH